MLPEKTYFLRFTHRDCSEVEEQEYTHLDDARAAYGRFADPVSAEIYTRIDLIEYTWATREERLLNTMNFAATEDAEWEDEYTPSCTAGDYSPGNPWDAPGMSIHDFI